MDEKEKDLDFNEIDARLVAGRYVCSGQRKRYLKTLIKDKKRVILSGIINIVIPATSPATNLAKTVANTSYSLIEYLHGMQGGSGSSPLGSTYFCWSYQGVSRAFS